MANVTNYDYSVLTGGWKVTSAVLVKIIDRLDLSAHKRRLKNLEGLYIQEVDDPFNPFSVSQVRYDKTSKSLLVDGQNFNIEGKVRERWRTRFSAFDKQTLALRYQYDFWDVQHEGPYRKGSGSGKIFLTTDKSRRYQFRNGIFMSSPMNQEERSFQMSRVNETHPAYDRLYHALSTNELPEVKELFGWAKGLPR